MLTMTGQGREKERPWETGRKQDRNRNRETGREDDTVEMERERASVLGREADKQTKKKYRDVEKESKMGKDRDGETDREKGNWRETTCLLIFPWSIAPQHRRSLGSTDLWYRGKAAPYWSGSRACVPIGTQRQGRSHSSLFLTPERKAWHCSRERLQKRCQSVNYTSETHMIIPDAPAKQFVPSNKTHPTVSQWHTLIYWHGNSCPQPSTKPPWRSGCC